MKKQILFRPSEVYAIMPNAKGKSNLENYDLMLERLHTKQKKYEAMKSKETKGAVKLLEEILNLELKIQEAEMKLLPNLSQGCKTHLRQKMIEVKFKRYQDVDNKYMTKGRELEEEAITFYSILKGKVFENNKERVTNDYFSGEIDIAWKDEGKVTRITDIKNSYNVHTFFKNEEDIKKQNYYQGIGYLDLYPTARMFSIANILLNNTPSQVLLDLHRESYKWDEGDTPVWRELQIIKNHIYTKKEFDEFCTMRGGIPVEGKAKEVYDSFVEIPNKDRIIEHSFARNEEEIQAVHKRIDECRLYLQMIYGI
jgi:hypothetical protein